MPSLPTTPRFRALDHVGYAVTDRVLDERCGTVLAHFRDRTATLDGKAMAVCMTHANAVRLYDD